MKNFFSIVLIALGVSLATTAQSRQQPKGLYRLQRFIYENGTSRNAGFSQYKYVADSVGLLIFNRPSNSTDRWGSMTVEVREPYPLRYTGEVPQGDDGHGTQIFDVSDRQFCFKWYNMSWPNMSRLNEFITEVYTRDYIEKDVATAFDMFENKSDTKGSSFFGWWVRIAAAPHPDGSGKRMQVPAIWKIYGPEMSMVVNMINGQTLGCNTTNTVRYENDSTIYEIGHRCDIHWLSENCHTLTFVQENGAKLTEIWVRGGLPAYWQSIFGTDVPLYIDGSQCMRQAVDAASMGDLQRAEAYIAEAITDKNVNIRDLCLGVVEIAGYLFDEKKQYAECRQFCESQLQTIADYAEHDHAHDASSRTFTHLVETYKAVATYRSGETEAGKKLMEDQLSKVDSEIERYRTVRGMEGYVNALYYCNLMMYHLGYDVFGAERTLLSLEALTLMAPSIVASNKAVLLNCRGNCYLLLGDKDSARKIYQQLKEQESDFFSKMPDDCPLKKAFI